MRIGELSERAGVSRDTIRFYERNGLIFSGAGQSETNNYRDYAEENVLWLGFVIGAREAGMSVADLRDIFEATGGGCEMSTAKQIVETKIEELRQRGEQIDQAIQYLKSALATGVSE